MVVTEGFSGNIALKTAEGTAKQIAQLHAQGALGGSLRSKLGYLLGTPRASTSVARHDGCAPRQRGGLSGSRWRRDQEPRRHGRRSARPGAIRSRLRDGAPRAARSRFAKCSRLVRPRPPCRNRRRASRRSRRSVSDKLASPEKAFASARTDRIVTDRSNWQQSALGRRRQQASYLPADGRDEQADLERKARHLGRVDRPAHRDFTARHIACRGRDDLGTLGASCRTGGAWRDAKLTSARRHRPRHRRHLDAGLHVSLGRHPDSRRPWA